MLPSLTLKKIDWYSPTSARRLLRQALGFLRSVVSIGFFVIPVGRDEVWLNRVTL